MTCTRCRGRGYVMHPDESKFGAHAVSCPECQPCAWCEGHGYRVVVKGGEPVRVPCIHGCQQ